jgi:hypothetical protein
VTAAPQPEDGSLPATLTALDDALYALIGPQTRLIDGRMIGAPSRYMELAASVTGEQANTGGGGGSKSRPPFWTDAFDKIREIDEKVALWQPAFTGVPPTVGRLRCLRARGWRPQDCRQLEGFAADCARWASDVDALLNPPRRWTLPSPCPACNTDTVYRRDNGGEMIRQPALQIAAEGCFCAKCRAYWAPDRFVWLARVLGSLPENVLE